VTGRVGHTLKKHRKPVFWIAFSLAIVGLVVYLAQDPQTLRVDSPVAAADPRFPDYVASLLGAPVHEGDAYTVLHNGDETFPAMLAALEKAKSRINFETYVFSDGELADRFVDAMARAAQRGVFVRIVLDPVGSSLDSKSTDKLKDAGAHLA
jgi:cardiolipin synthase